MKRIDRETVQKILDTADIVDVVSDFVTLKRRGANYIGLCPFHSERTPSFSVSKAKGICKCFSCGKGGSPVNFLMELEQMSFNEALRYLAKKYNIEIKEHELNEEEREKATQRENMLAVNQFAMQHFESNLLNTDDGKEIGYSYFRDRGITDSAIARFHLGYALDKPTDLYDAAIKQGYPEQSIIETGLSVKQESGRIYDRFKGRVIYPVFGISGKVVAFGGRTLRNDKKVAKYVNSPESVIYSKSRELYGLYQAKNAIARKDKCILVEGYMDVISMSQSGIENVVASSGTSLTEGQIRLIHRFTSNVTVIYDSDAAGIKASLRGIDMLLAEGLQIKVVLLPDGDDPDSFAQSHSSTEVEDYISANETDFIRFKTKILLEGVEDDPLKRANVITDIVKSIAVIPDEIVRTVYIQECSRSLNVDETTLTLQVAKNRNERAEKQSTDQARAAAHESIEKVAEVVKKREIRNREVNDETILAPHERELIRYVIRYGMVNLNSIDDEGNPASIPVIDYIDSEMKYDGLEFTIPVYGRIFKECLELQSGNWSADYDRFIEQSLETRENEWQEGEEAIRQSANSLDQIKAQETALQTAVDTAYSERENNFRLSYFARHLISSYDDEIRATATELATSRHKLSKVHSKFSRLETEQERLEDRLPLAIYGLKDAHVQCHLRSLREKLKTLSSSAPADMNELGEILREITRLDDIRRQYAKCLGERVVAPK